jgi:hypothetical protein
VKKCHISLDDVELRLVEGGLIELIQHLPRIECLESCTAAGTRFWLSYPMTSSPSLSNLNRIYMDEFHVDDSTLSLLLGSYKLVKRIDLIAGKEDDKFEESEQVHIPNQLFKRRELDSLNLECNALSPKVSYLYSGET